MTKDMKRVWVDKETTGTDPLRHSVIQLAAIVEINGEVVDEFECFLAPLPGRLIDPRALEVNQRTEDEIKAFPPASVGYSEFKKVLSKHINPYDRGDKAFFSGFNAIFDFNMGHTLAQGVGDKYFGSWFYYPPLDVAVIAGHKLAHVRHTFPNWKLGTLCAHAGIKPEDFGGNAHDALVDISMTRALFYWLEGLEAPRAS